MKNGFLPYNRFPNIKGQSILASKSFCTSVLSTGRRARTHRDVRTPQEPSSNLTGRGAVRKQPILCKTPVTRRTTEPCPRLGAPPGETRPRGPWAGAGAPLCGAGRGTRRPGAAVDGAEPGRAGRLPAPRQAAGREGGPERDSPA